MNSIETKLLELIDKDYNFNNVENLNMDLDLKEDLGLDSLSLTELVLSVEDEFNIAIDYTSIAQESTIKTLHDIIVDLYHPNELY